MISAQQLANRRASASTQIQAAFATTITIEDSDPIAAARWTSAEAAAGELAGLLTTYDLAFRIERALLAGITITRDRTKITENGITYRVERIRSALGDPAIVVECKAI